MRVLYEYIAEHKEVDKTVYIEPMIIVRSNLDTYLDSK